MALRLVGEVTLDGAGFERGLSRIGASAAANLKSFVVSAFGIYGIQQAITKTVQSCDELVHASEKLGVTVEQLQVMRQAAKESGIEFDKLVSSANKLAAIRGNILQGGKGSKEQMAALQRLGVTPDQIKNMTGMQMMMGPIAGRVNQVNPADIANDLRTVFGRAFGDIIPVLKTDFDGLAGKMQRLGIIIDTDTAVKVKYLGDESSLLAQLLTTQAAPLIVQFAEAVVWAIGRIKGISSFWGAGTASWTGGDFKKELLSIATWGMLKGPKFDEGAALGAMDKTESGWTMAFDELRARLAAEAEKLKHPTAPVIPGGFSNSSDKMKPWNVASDSLISVGNFLGSGRGQIGNVAAKHLEVARSSLTRLESIDNKLDKLSDSGGDDLDFGN